MGLRWIALLAVALAVSGCCFGGSKIPRIRGVATVVPIPGQAVEGEDVLLGSLTGEDADSALAEESVGVGAGRGRVAAWVASWERLMRRVGGNLVYYDFDLATLGPDTVAKLRRMVTFLRENQDAKVTIEGHTDSRGTREYNLGLGERRAKAVRDFMVIRGVAPGRIRVVSLGEEDPAVEGDSDGNRALNRRAVINIREE